MKKIFQIITLIILISCTESEYQNLESDSTIKSVFNHNEIEDLNRILDFFNDQICTITGHENINYLECYNDYCQLIYESANSDTCIWDMRIPYNKQQDLYKKIEDSTFTQIWVFNMCWKANSPEIIKAGGPIFNPDTLKRLDINRGKKYSTFIQKLGQDYEMIKYYYDDLQLAGSVSPAGIGEVLTEYKTLDFNDVRARLFIAIHYLTLNDENNRIEKY